MNKAKSSEELVSEHVKVIGRLIGDAEYHFTNLQYLSQLNEEDKMIVSGFMVLSNYKSILWYLIVLDLNKLLNDRDNDKFNLWKLIRRTKENRNKQYWKKPVELPLLIAYEDSLIRLEDQLSKLTQIRDEHVAHFDNKEVHFRISLSELKELINFCKEVYNTINYWLTETTTYWDFPEMNMINPVIYNLSNYRKLRSLFFKNHAENKSTIEMNELSKIIRPQARVSTSDY